MNTIKKIVTSRLFIVLFILSFVFTIAYLIKSGQIQAQSQAQEKFENTILGSKSGFGFQKQSTDKPMFINFYPEQLGSDFRLADLLRRLKVFKMTPTITNGNQYPAYIASKPFGPIDTSNTYRGITQVNAGAKRVPIIIVPSIGASKIYAKWSKNGSDYVKKLDAYGNFETSDRWKCKDIQDTWTNLWFPKGTNGLVEYCWSVNAKIDTSNGYLSNGQGVDTTINEIGQLDFMPGYDTLIKSFVDIGYVPGSTLYGLNYDFRKITTDVQVFNSSLQNLITSLNGPCIIIGHGLGACVANQFLANMNQGFKDSKIKAFVSIAGTFGGVPKALKTLMSGDYIANKQESKLIRNTTLNYDGLHLMLPNPTVYKDFQIVSHNSYHYKTTDIPLLAKKVGSTVPYEIIANFNNNTLRAPGVLSYVMAGTGLYTESNYIYSNLLDDPLTTFKNFSGDGTVPEFASKYPLEWAKKQKNPVIYRSYENAEHLTILSMYEPVSDLLKVVSDLNGLKWNL